MPVGATASEPANYINHFILIVDESLSMRGLRAAVVRVFDAFIARLAVTSKTAGQETRITVYFFNSYGTQKCVIYDMDVLRVPSLEGLYHPHGNTALLQTFQLAMSDLREIPVKYGNHSFVVFGWTDGEENDSYFPRTRENQSRVISEWSRALAAAPDNETYGLFVPDQMGKVQAQQFGFPASNISVWDSTSEQGIEEAATLMGDVAESYMAARAQGVRGYSVRSGGGLFQMRDFSAADVRHELTPMTPGSYYFLDVTAADCGGNPHGKVPIEKFFEAQRRGPYPKGKCYYQFTDTALIQSYKHVAIESEGHVYSGTLDQVRGFVGLPAGAEIKVKPEPKPGMTVFVQSTSHNRNLFAGTRLLVFR